MRRRVVFFDHGTEAIRRGQQEIFSPSLLEMVESRVFESFGVQRFGRAAQRKGDGMQTATLTKPDAGSNRGRIPKGSERKKVRPELTQFGIRNVLFGVTYFA